MTGNDIFIMKNRQKMTLRGQLKIPVTEGGVGDESDGRIKMLPSSSINSSELQVVL